ncbi:hypothetical protein CANCADRAFT_90966 [Tortispora caseinolytica NRRL Y-17796]|uniref:low-specificity L-threonine aldolase n=1 Tax=Tortispora caseinolytica NRRL Y-17796 TaxID=767744 RepID=A0A1E4TLT2_9ASCO|nr:hypothetical protein CANCADRAFT_90966 [Tortispora caseinolytica NRRL Y-17796]
MVAAMGRATLGDAVYYDKSTVDFEARVAALAGKEKGLFVPSGTMSNQLGLRLHVSPPGSILCDVRSHVYAHESAGLATLSQAMVTTVHPTNGRWYITLDDIRKWAILSDDIHVAPTQVISLENTLGGSIMPFDEMKRISEWARSNGLAMHLDGARLWDAVAATGVSLVDYCNLFDTVSLCFSKGLGAPIGSVLVGSAQHIKRATHFRKQQGGGMRQQGLLCEAASEALDEVFPNLQDVHQKAASFAADLAALGYNFQLPVHTNFVFLDLDSAGVDPAKLVAEAAEKGITVSGARIAFHHQTADDAAAELKQILAELIAESKKNGSYSAEKLNDDVTLKGYSRAGRS